MKNKATNSKFVQWYEIEDNEVNSPEADCSGVQCSITFDSDLESGDYEWYVRGWNDNGSGGWSDKMNFTVQGFNSPPSKVTLTKPYGTNGKSPVFTWVKGTYTTWYKLFVWNSLEERIHAKWYESSAICTDGICSVSLESKLPNDSYEWWVKSWNDNGGIWCDGMSFTVSD